jgi:hypothetical protein
MQPPPSGMEMEAVCPSELLVSIYKFALHYSLEDHHQEANYTTAQSEIIFL